MSIYYSGSANIRMTTASMVSSSSVIYMTTLPPPRQTPEELRWRDAAYRAAYFGLTAISRALR